MRWSFRSQDLAINIHVHRVSTYMIVITQETTLRGRDFIARIPRTVHVHHFLPPVSLLEEGEDGHELRVHHDSDADESTHSVDYNILNPEQVPSDRLVFQPSEATANGQSSAEPANEQ